jgi:hypothetical protein
LKDVNGTITDKLILLRNPWAEDSYNGTFSNASDFTANQTKQVPLSYLLPGDGVFLMTEADFINTFQVFEISRYINSTTNFTSNFQTASRSILA